RMRRRHQHPAAALTPLTRQARVCLGGGCGVRAPDLSKLLVARANTRPDRLITDAASADGAAYLGEVRIERSQTLHVAGIANIHCGGERGNARPRTPVTRLEEIRHRP